MKKLQSILPVVLGAGALAVGLIVFLDQEKEATSPSEAAPFTFQVKAATASLDAERARRTPLNPLVTNTMLTDVFDSTHIVRAAVVAAEQSSNSTITLQPLSYVKGSAIAEGTVVVKTHTNANFDHLIGQEVVAGINFRAELDGNWVLSHNILSLTMPSALRPDNLDVSEAFYSDMLAIYGDYQADVDSARAQPMVNNIYPLPSGFLSAVKERLLHYFAESGTTAAEAASIELYDSGYFQGQLTDLDLDIVANAVRTSLPTTVDRGTGYRLLRAHRAAKLSLSDLETLVRDEKRLVVLDHMGAMLYECGYDEVDVTNMLASMYTNVFEETEQSRLNAVTVAGQFGSRLAIPELNKLLGRESWLPLQRELLNVYRYLADDAALPALVRYLNGGLGNEGSDAIAGFGKQMPAPIVRVQNDCIANIELHKRTLVAIATIDSENSNAFIRQAYAAAKDGFMREFLEFLHPKNKGWRLITTVLTRDPQSFEEIRAIMAANANSGN